MVTSKLLFLTFIFAVQITYAAPDEAIIKINRPKGEVTNLTQSTESDLNILLSSNINSICYQGKGEEIRVIANTLAKNTAPFCTPEELEETYTNDFGDCILEFGIKTDPTGLKIHAELLTERGEFSYDIKMKNCSTL